jgi:hypothetical protein
MKASESLQNDQSTATEKTLRLAFDTTPAFIHTARPDGYFDYFNPLRFGIDIGAEWDSQIPCCIRTTTKKHEEFGQPVFEPAVPVRSVFEFVALKEGTAGFSVASDRSGRAMELYCIGSGLILTLKNASVRKRSCGGVKRIYLKRLPLTDLLGWLDPFIIKNHCTTKREMF